MIPIKRYREFSKRTYVCNLFFSNRNVSSTSSNIHQFKINNLFDINSYFSEDLTLVPQRLYSTSNISLLFHLTHLSSFITTGNEFYSLIDLYSQDKSIPNIHRLQINSFSSILLTKSEHILRIFPRLRSLSIDQVNEYEILTKIFDKFLPVLPNKQSIIYLRIGGLVFDEICLEFINDEQIMCNFENLFIPLFIRKNAYCISLNRKNRLVDFWF